MMEEKYVATNEIGSGGFGTVYEGTRLSDNLKVALKKIRSDKVRRFGVVDSNVVPLEFKLMVDAAERKIPGIIKPYEIIMDNDAYVIIMELAEPKFDLFEYVCERGPLSEAQTRFIFLQIVFIVKKCHDNGIVHRDIKGENILFNPGTGQVKLIDFGCGDILQEIPYTEIQGTRNHFPPEWFHHCRCTGRQMDTWGLGLLLYFLLQAKEPFENERQIRNCSIVFDKNIQLPGILCRSLICAILQKDPEERLSLSQILQHRWMFSMSSTRLPVF